MRLIEWEVAEDGYEEQILIPKEQRDLAAKEGIGTENKQKVTVQDVATKADLQLYRVFYQGNEGINKCFRNNISWIININRYLALSEPPKNKTGYSFPSSETKTEFPN